MSVLRTLRFDSDSRAKATGDGERVRTSVDGSNRFRTGAEECKGVLVVGAGGCGCGFF